MPYRLLSEFQNLFDGHKYLHRNSSLGDFVAIHLYEDLLELNRSHKLEDHIGGQRTVLNVRNTRQGIQARRGDGTLGESVPNGTVVFDSGFLVPRGKIATIEIGVEVKILAKAMIKQIDRVVGDLRNQVEQFRLGGGNPICVGIVGLNHAERCTSYEREREYKTDGESNRHPCQEAEEARKRLLSYAKPAFDEFLILDYSATNESPFAFKWVNRETTELDYGAALVRISRAYDERF